MAIMILIFSIIFTPTLSNLHTHRHQFMHARHTAGYAGVVKTGSVMAIMNLLPVLRHGL